MHNNRAHREVPREGNDSAKDRLLDAGENVLALLAKMKRHGRVQMGVGTAAQFILPLPLRIGTHVLAWGEKSAQQKLSAAVDRFCDAAQDMGISSHHRVLKAHGDIGTPHTTGLSFATSLFLPAARAVHRALQDGKYSELEHHVRAIMAKTERGGGRMAA